MKPADCMRWRDGICACAAGQRPWLDRLGVWCIWNEVTFSLSSKQTWMSECCLPFPTYTTVTMHHLTFQSLGDNAPSGKNQLPQGIKWRKDSNMWVVTCCGCRWMQIQRRPGPCHWISTDNYIRKANGVSDSIVLMFLTGQRSVNTLVLFFGVKCYIEVNEGQNSIKGLGK